MSGAGGGPLTGLRVVEMAGIGPAPFAGLAMLDGSQSARPGQLPGRDRGRIPMGDPAVVPLGVLINQ